MCLTGVNDGVAMGCTGASDGGVLTMLCDAEVTNDGACLDRVRLRVMDTQARNIAVLYSMSL